MAYRNTISRVRDGQLEVLSGTRWRKGEKARCTWCGKEFARAAMPPSHARKMCSEKCIYAHRHAVSWKHRIYKTCEICGGQFKVAPNKAPRLKTCGNPRCKFLMNSKTTSEYYAKRRELLNARGENYAIRNN